MCLLLLLLPQQLTILTINNLKHSTALLGPSKSKFRSGLLLNGKCGDSMSNFIPVSCFMSLTLLTSSSSVLTPCLLLDQIITFMPLSLLQSLSEILLHSLPYNSSPYNTSSLTFFCSASPEC